MFPLELHKVFLFDSLLSAGVKPMLHPPVLLSFFKGAAAKLPRNLRFFCWLVLETRCSWSSRHRLEFMTLWLYTKHLQDFFQIGNVLRFFRTCHPSLDNDQDELRALIFVANYDRGHRIVQMDRPLWYSRSWPQSSHKLPWLFSLPGRML